MFCSFGILRTKTITYNGSFDYLVLPWFIWNLKLAHIFMRSPFSRLFRWKYTLHRFRDLHINDPIYYYY